MTVIDRYDLSIGGLHIAIFASPGQTNSCSSAPYDGALYLSPSARADILVRGEGIYSDFSGRVEWLTALAFFLSRVRGLPDSELLVEYCDKVTELQIFSTGDDLYRINLPKCKQLCELLTPLDGGVECKTVRLSLDGIWHAVELPRCPPLYNELLKRIKLLPDGYSDYQLIIDEKGRIEHGERIPPLLPLLSVSYCLLEKSRTEGEIRLIYRGENILVRDGCCYLPCTIIKKS